MIKAFLSLLCLLLFFSTASAHPGRTDASGGHTDRSTGEYHYHNGGQRSSSSSYSSSSTTTSPTQTISTAQEPERIGIIANAIHYGRVAGIGTVCIIGLWLTWITIRYLRRRKKRRATQSYNEQKRKLFDDYQNGLINAEQFNARRDVIERIKPKEARKTHPFITSFVCVGIIFAILAGYYVKYGNALKIPEFLRGLIGKSNENLTVHYIDVGQADSILIELPNSQTMLIDGGNRAYGAAVVNYLQNNGVSAIDYLIATHPHEDHIGGLPDVIDSPLEIKSVYMPRVGATTRIFEELLTSIENKGLIINTAQAGVNILSIPDLQIDIIAPVGDSHSDINDWSAVIKLKYKDTTFLFMGDAETTSENQIHAGVDADVLKVGHHGSESSTSASFLNKVTPDYAVICVGKDNSYGHPDDTTLAALENSGAEVFRTDEQGTIIIISDGGSITVDKEPAPYSPNVP